MRPSARQNTRSGSAIILIAAFLVVMAVLSFGFLAYVMDQRGAARNSQIQGLLHHALTSGRDHAKFLLDHQAAQNGSGTGLTGTWATAFAALPGYPSADSEPDPTLRRTQRLTLVAAVNPGEWGDANAVDLFRNIPGLASPADQTQWNGHDRGNTVHDGTARWLPLGFFDRSLRRTSDPARAAYRLRYAVAVIDLQGHLAFNKQRYEHALPPGAGHLDEMRKSLGSWHRGERIISASGSAPQYNTVSDPWSGADDQTRGFRSVRYNSFRPIPADHALLAGALLYHGFDVEDVQLSTTPLQDGLSGARVSTLNDPANVARSQATGDDSIYAVRTPQTLPDYYRRMGFYLYSNQVPPIRERYLDHFPFEWSSVPPTSAIHPAYRAPGRNFGRAWILSVDAPVGSVTALTGGNQFLLDHLSTTDPWSGVARPTATAARGNSNIHRELRRLSMEQIRNRHPAHLVAMLNGYVLNDFGVHDNTTAVAGFGPSGSTASMAPVVEGLLWLGADVVNWEGIRQQLRLGGTKLDSWDSARGWQGSRTATSDDDIVQAFTPFSTSSGQFRTVVGVDRQSQKNALEMSTQFPVNIRTAPPRVIDAVLRLVLTELPDPTTLTWVSREGSDADRERFDRAVAHIRRGIIQWRTSATLLSADVSPAEWIAAIPAAADITNLGAFKNALVNQPGFDPDLNTTSTPKLGLASLVYGGPSLRGPAAHFRVHSLAFANGQPASTATQAILVVEGTHVKRLIGDRQSAPDFEPHIWLRLTAATAGLSTRIPEYDARTGPRGVTASGGFDRRLTGVAGAPAKPFEILTKDPAPGFPNTVSTIAGNRTTMIIDLRPPGTATLGRNEFMGGYGTAADLEPLVAELSAPSPTPGLVRCVAFQDFATQRWRENLPDRLEWISNGPGLTFTNDTSRHFRIAIRARLESLDNTTDAWERTWHVVYRPDPDLSGYAGGTSMHDGDILYQDEDNSGRLRGVNPDGSAAADHGYMYTE